MRAGTVVEQAALLRTLPGLEGKRFVAVQSGKEALWALDLTGAQAGQRVLLSTGAAAARLCMDAPVDAAVVAVLGEK